MNQALDKAIEVAKQHIPIQQYVCIPEAQVGFTVTCHEGRYRVYSADAWERPTESPLLPWSTPRGTKVAHVATDGSVQLIE